jgi:uncharacterized protein YutD
MFYFEYLLVYCGHACEQYVVRKVQPFNQNVWSNVLVMGIVERPFVQ